LKTSTSFLFRAIIGLGGPELEPGFLEAVAEVALSAGDVVDGLGRELNAEDAGEEDICLG